MTTFKVGDRVRVYDSVREVCGEVASVGPFALSVVLDNFVGLHSFHPKQCRRLVKKKPKCGKCGGTGNLAPDPKTMNIPCLCVISKYRTDSQKMLDQANAVIDEKTHVHTSHTFTSGNDSTDPVYSKCPVEGCVWGRAAVERKCEEQSESHRAAAKPRRWWVRERPNDFGDMCGWDCLDEPPPNYKKWIEVVEVIGQGEGES